MRTNRLIRIILYTALAIIITACAPAQHTVTFSVFGDPEELAAYQNLVDAFQAKHPDIAVQLQHVPSQGDYNQKLAAGFSAGQPPDVFLLNYRRVATFADQGGLQPLESYFNTSKLIHPADFFPQTLKVFQIKEQTWCIPQNISSLVVYYNRDLFDKAGLPHPAEGWTRDDFTAAARALTQDTNSDGIIDQYGAGIEAGLYRLMPFIWQNGGDIVDNRDTPTRLTLTSPAAMEALQWFVGLQTNLHVVPDATAEAAETSENRFLNGQLAMYFNSRRGTPTYRTITGFEWDVAPLPRGEQAAGILHSDGYCMAAAAKDKTAAWTFIEFANSSEGQTLIAATGRTVPSLKTVAESPAFLNPDLPPMHSRVFIDVIPTLKGVPIMPTWAAIEETANREVERAFYGQASAQEAAQAADDLTREYFKSE